MCCSSGWKEPTNINDLQQCVAESSAMFKSTYGLNHARYNSIRFNFILIAPNHWYSLKRLNRPYIYDTPLTLAPKRARTTTKSTLIRMEEILRRNADWGILPSRYKKQPFPLTHRIPGSFTSHVVGHQTLSTNINAINSFISFGI